MYEYFVCKHVLLRHGACRGQKEGTGSFGAGITDVGELPWTLGVEPLGEQPVVLATELALQPVTQILQNRKASVLKTVLFQ